MAFHTIAYVEFVVGIADLLVFSVALAMFARLLINEKKAYEQINTFEGDVGAKRKKLSGKKLFHGIIILFLFVRGTYFLVNPFFVDGDLPAYTESMNAAWKSLGSLIFLLAYFFLLLFWADFCYRVSRSHIRVFVSLRTPLLVFLSLITVLAICVCVVSIALGMDPNASSKFDMSLAAIMALLALFVAVGFFYYGVRLIVVLRAYSSLSMRKQAQTRKVVAVAVGCTLCFLTQSIMILVSVFAELSSGDTGRSWSVPDWVVFVFFFGLETVPSVAMLYLLRKHALPQSQSEREANAPLMRPYS